MSEPLFYLAAEVQIMILRNDRFINPRNKCFSNNFFYFYSVLLKVYKRVYIKFKDATTKHFCFTKFIIALFELNTGSYLYQINSTKIKMIKYDQLLTT